MRKALFSLAIFCFPLILNAQTHDAVPRLEAGLQLVFADLGPVRPVGGTGGRFHYNFNDHDALDTEIIGVIEECPSIFIQRIYDLLLAVIRPRH